MSQSDKVSKSVGKLTVSSGTVKIGNTSSVVAQSLPAVSTFPSATGTLTTANMFARFGTSNPTAAATLTSPTASALVAAQPGCSVGDSFPLTIINTNGTNSITLAGGTGITLVGSGTIAVSSSASFIMQFTNITSGSEAVSVIRV